MMVDKVSNLSFLIARVYFEKHRLHLRFAKSFLGSDIERTSPKVYYQPFFCPSAANNLNILFVCIGC
jgi:hypothetical protein